MNGEGGAVGTVGMTGGAPWPDGPGIASCSSWPTLKQRSVLPGFGLTLGFTIAYLSLIVLIPLAGLFLKTSTAGWSSFWETVTDSRVLAAFRLSFGAAAISATVNLVFGLIVAWVLVRYRFPGRRLVDALIDLPFALPTAVAGIALTAVYSRNGVLGHFLEAVGIKVAFAPLGVIVAMTFVSLPFVVRTIEPLLEDLEPELEEAAASLGARRWQTLWRVILPELWPALLTGYTLALARALGEYGSIIFISGNMPMKTEIVPLLIVMKLEQFDYAGATAIAVLILFASFSLLLVINGLQRWSVRRHSGQGH